MTVFPAYQTRRVAFEALAQFGDWSVKLYSIDSHGRVPPGHVLAAARARLPDLLPDAVDGGRAETNGQGGAAEGVAGADMHGEAFSIVHAGEDAVWLLVFWWTDHCLLHGRMVGASLDRPEEFTLPTPDTLVACTWELAVVQHERDAWVRNVQGPGTKASFEAYRADVLTGFDV